MRIVPKLLLTVLFAFILALTSLAQEPAVVIGKLPTLKRVWGDQEVLIPAVNKTEELRFLVIVARSVFSEGLYLKPERIHRTIAIIDPSASITVPTRVEIASNWGAATVTITIYEVIDTLDALGMGTKLLEQPFLLRFHLPEALNAYLNERLSVPPAQERSPEFDNEFSRVACRLLHEGKNLEKIAEMAQADTGWVKSWASELYDKGLLTARNVKARPSFAYIESRTAEQGRILADSLAAQLASLITANLPAYHKVRDSLREAGTAAVDSMAFMDGGSILYYPYPVIGMFFYWMDLGQRFITRGERLLLFKDTDPCQALAPAFTYLVEGGSRVTGNQYFKYERLGNTRLISWADTIPDLLCPENFRERTAAMPMGEWGYAVNRKPESFMFKASVIEPGLRRLGEGAIPLLMKADSSFNVLMTAQGVTAPTPADRYWFWNLLVTRTSQRLDKDKVVPRRGNGFFRYSELR